MFSQEMVTAEIEFDGASWYALYTRHQHEKMVDQVLTNKGFNTFLPLYATTHNWKDRTKSLTLPLFPCYVFLKGGIERRLHILTTPGIYGLVSTAGQPAAIPDIEIESIRRVVESGARVEAHPYLKCGNWVRVKCGPLAGIEGILVRQKNISRLVLSVEILGTAAAIEVSVSQVEEVNASRSRGSGPRFGKDSVHARAAEASVLT
ncbi:MAG TPA: UpxY family transcription antiterminator [Candidatus Acidoferrum sp.]|nr:UpxY family transcription antiterminator [Candidatus Acidoferrum sp.]